MSEVCCSVNKSWVTYVAVWTGHEWGFHVHIKQWRHDDLRSEHCKTLHRGGRVVTSCLVEDRERRHRRHSVDKLCDVSVTQLSALRHRRHPRLEISLSTMRHHTTRWLNRYVFLEYDITQNGETKKNYVFRYSSQEYDTRLQCDSKSKRYTLILLNTDQISLQNDSHKVWYVPCRQGVIHNCRRGVIHTCRQSVIHTCRQGVIHTCRQGVIHNCRQAVIQTCRQGVIHTCRQGVIHTRRQGVGVSTRCYTNLSTRCYTHLSTRCYTQLSTRCYTHLTTRSVTWCQLSVVHIGSHRMTHACLHSVIHKTRRDTHLSHR